MYLTIAGFAALNLKWKCFFSMALIEVREGTLIPGSKFDLKCLSIDNAEMLWKPIASMASLTRSITLGLSVTFLVE